MNDIYKILIFSSLSYLTLFVISKLLGKKQIAELDFIDYVTGISVGSIAAEMATDTETPFYYYLIAMAIFFLFDLLVTVLGRKTNFLKRFLRGVPIILIDKGQVNFQNLKKSKIDFYDLVGLARDKGYFDLSEIEYAIFETNGDLSILATDEARQVKKQDFAGIQSQKPTLVNYVVVDGQASGFALKQIGKDTGWLMKEIKNQEVDINNIMYAVFDEQTKQLNITLKN